MLIDALSFKRRFAPVHSRAQLCSSVWHVNLDLDSFCYYCNLSPTLFLNTLREKYLWTRTWFLSWNVSSPLEMSRSVCRQWRPSRATSAHPPCASSQASSKHSHLQWCEPSIVVQLCVSCFASLALSLFVPWCGILQCLRVCCPPGLWLFWFCR